jgi:mRNA interferase MazF
MSNAPDVAGDAASSRKGPEPEQEPRRVQPRIIAAPKHEQIYWCDFPLDAQLPEMWKTRPVVVLSYKNTLHGPCLVVPTSTKPQGSSPWAWELSMSIDGQRSWVVCNHLYTVAPSRLSQVKGQTIRVPNADFNEILKRVTAWLPLPFELDKHGREP